MNEEALQAQKRLLVRGIDRYITEKGDEIIGHVSDVMRRHIEGLRQSAHEHLDLLFEQIRNQ